MKVSILAAVAENGVIGLEGDLPWRLPEDLRRFKLLTMGHHLLMGRRTWESIGRALPGRTTVVISRGTPDLPEGVRLAASVDEAIAVAAAAGDDEAFIVGGGEIFRQTLARADRLYLTRVRAAVPGDVRFPDLDLSAWRLVSRQDHDPDDRHAHPMTFLVYERASGAEARPAP